MRPFIWQRPFKIARVPALALAVLAAGCEHNTVSREGVSATPAALVTAPSESKPRDVTIDNFSFNPPTLTIPAGATVSWVNHDDIPHTVTANDKAFASNALDTDDRYSHVFTAPGTYSYFCAVHPHMTGQIIVK